MTTLSSRAERGIFSPGVRPLLSLLGKGDVVLGVSEGGLVPALAVEYDELLGAFGDLVERVEGSAARISRR